MRTFVIGRNPFADVVIADTTVGSHHAEIVVTEDGRYHLTDCGEDTGTWRRGDAASGEGGQWRRVRQTFISADEPLKFGNYISSAEELLRSARRIEQAATSGTTRGKGYHHATRGTLRGRVQRDPATGEIVRRRP